VCFMLYSRFIEKPTFVSCHFSRHIIPGLSTSSSHFDPSLSHKMWTRVRFTLILSDSSASSLDSRYFESGCRTLAKSDAEAVT